MSSQSDVKIRPAGPTDIPLVLYFVRALAEYERLADHVVADEATLARSLFGPRPYAECILAHVDDAPAGFAVYFHNFSTFAGRPGLYLEDIFVEPKFRRHRVGLALFRALSQIALERDCAHLQWSVLDWNELAIGFYKKLGATFLSEWKTMRLGREHVERLASS